MEKRNLDLVLLNCSAQVNALKSSHNIKSQDSKLYNETLLKFNKTFEKHFEATNKHEKLLLKIAEKLKVKNGFLQLQNAPNNALKKLQNQIELNMSNIYKDSDNFVGLLKETMNQFQNLETEFDESVLFQKKLDCVEKRYLINEQLKDFHQHYEALKSNLLQKPDYCNLEKLEKSYNFENHDLFVKNVIAKTQQNEAQLNLAQKNIVFLQKRVEELQVIHCNNLNI